MKCEETLNGILMQVMRVHFLRTHSLLEETGLYHGQPPLLLLLEKENGQSQKMLADKLKVKPSTINVMIKRMEKTELIERKQDENDQRTSRIFITEKGREKCKKLYEINEEMEKECLQNFTVEEKIIIRRLLIQIKDNLKSCMD
ncbi:MarR family transcriptional regulator [Romboutsia maritimum]|uniref:MarR family transcriptional regulator n=1 Tax=Romboutsia maritimum TaxID=2020948 RepID=A0A371IS89_9FIRM|nr:MarR family transcriptional regulator [Romboutsia maritimum]RDY23352.1 MarR family transcriptional regulator [Romboutsia maritimum]